MGGLAGSDARRGDGRAESLRRTGASLLVTANPGCQIQWAAGVRRAGLPVRVLHISEVLDAALAGRAWS